MSEPEKNNEKITEEFYYYELFGRSYNLTTIPGRIILRNDLLKLGFFDIQENKKYYPWFAKERIGMPNVLELLDAVKLFTIIKTPRGLKPEN